MCFCCFSLVFLDLLFFDIFPIFSYVPSEQPAEATDRKTQKTKIRCKTTRRIGNETRIRSMTRTGTRNRDQDPGPGPWARDEGSGTRDQKHGPGAQVPSPKWCWVPIGQSPNQVVPLPHRSGSRSVPVAIGPRSQQIPDPHMVPSPPKWICF